MPHFQKLLSRKHTTLVDSILLAAWNDKERFKNIAELPNYLHNLEIIEGDFYFDTEWVDEVIKKYADEDVKFFKNFVERGYEYGEKLVTFARGVSASSEEPISLFKQSVEHLKNLLVFLPETHPLAKIIENKLVSILENKGLSGEKIHDVLLEISKPRKLNGPALEIKELNEIHKNCHTAVEIQKALGRHVEKFAYLGYREPFSKGYDFAFFKEKLKDSGEDNITPFEPNIILSQAEQDIVDLMQEYVYFRNYRTEKLYEALYYIEPLWQKVSEALGLPSRSLFYYAEGEIPQLLSSDIQVDEAIIKERENGYALLLHDDVISILVGSELASHKELREGFVEQSQSIGGMVACKGVAKGKVKIVLKASEQFKVEAGDILVTSMTTPDFIPCMQKAVAFITDEGGITCHAAIVAREMKKPCIIGTKNATKILRDGDVVEVDAERGIIQIVKE